MSARAALLLAFLLAAPAAAQRQIHVWDGEQPGEGFGSAVAAAGDLDGDGRGDLLVGAPRAEGGMGAILILSGADGGEIRRVSGPRPRARLGEAVAGGADVDGDGVPDVMAGAPGMGNQGTDSGLALVFSGADGSHLHSLYGRGSYQFFAQSAALPGDVDGDGHADPAVGANQEPRADGVLVGGVRVFSGADGSVLHAWVGDAEGDMFGHAVSGAGDVDADGVPDVIIGALSADVAGHESGTASVRSGRDGRLLWQASGDAGGDRFGFAVDGIGDVNGDGHADFVVGAPGHDAGGDSAGRITVFSGRDGAVLARFDGRHPGDELGQSVAGLGDVDGDGVPDLAAGAYQFFNDMGGYVVVLSGADGRLLTALRAEARGDHFGYAVAGPGDVDGDGLADVAVGAPYAAAGRPRAGRVYVYAVAEGDGER